MFCHCCAADVEIDVEIVLKYLRGTSYIATLFTVTTPKVLACL